MYLTCFNTSPCVLRFSVKQSSLGSVGFSVGSTIGSVVVLFVGTVIRSVGLVPARIYLKNDHR